MGRFKCIGVFVLVVEEYLYLGFYLILWCLFCLLCGCCVGWGFICDVEVDVMVYLRMEGGGFEKVLFLC